MNYSSGIWKCGLLTFAGAGHCGFHNKVQVFIILER